MRKPEIRAEMLPRAITGAQYFTLCFGSIVGVAAGIGLIFSRSYRLARYLAWLDMDKHRQDVAYQPFQSVMSFGSGGALGLGLGRHLRCTSASEADDCECCEMGKPNHEAAICRRGASERAPQSIEKTLAPPPVFDRGGLSPTSSPWNLREPASHVRARNCHRMFLHRSNRHPMRLLHR